MSKSTPSKAELERMAAELSATWVLVGTNQGTYDANEAHRRIGTGDPRHADVMIYEQVGKPGKTRHHGPSGDNIPGRIRHFNSELSAKQVELSKLREQIKAAR